MSWIITRDQYLNKAEVQRLLSALADAKDLALHRRAFYNHVREYYIFRVLLETGVRVFELTALECGDFCNGVLIVRHGKGDKRRQILLSKSTQRMLVEFLSLKKELLNESTEPGDPLFLSARKKAYSTGGVRKRVKAWFADVGISPELSCHACRHTAASHLIAAGVDLPTVRDNLGHASLAVTSIYAHSLKTDLGELDPYR